MQTLLRMTLLAVTTAIGCSCSWFAKKPVEIANRIDPSTTHTVQSTESAPGTYPPEPYRFGISPAGPLKAATEISNKDVITILIQADPQLNRFGGNAHTLFLCIYQLKDPNGFNQLAEEKNGFQKLLECNRFDATVANARQFVVQPGQELNYSRNRAEGARYIGIVAGYYGMGREKVTEISLLSPGRRGDPSGSMIRIDLGPYEITSVKVN